MNVESNIIYDYLKTISVIRSLDRKHWIYDNRSNNLFNDDWPGNDESGPRKPLLPSQNQTRSQSAMRVAIFVVLWCVHS
jgi:hypothetical protein